MPLLWLAYPLLVHAAVLTDEPLLEAAALGLLLGLILLAPLSRRRLWAALTLAGGLLAAAAFSYSGWGIYFLYLPPVLLNAFLCALFAQSLGAARTPIISAVARSIRGGELPPNTTTHALDQLAQDYPGARAACSSVAPLTGRCPWV